MTHPQLQATPEVVKEQSILQRSEKKEGAVLLEAFRPLTAEDIAKSIIAERAAERALDDKGNSEHWARVISAKLEQCAFGEAPNFVAYFGISDNLHKLVHVQFLNRIQSLVTPEEFNAFTTVPEGVEHNYTTDILVGEAMLSRAVHLDGEKNICGYFYNGVNEANEVVDLNTAQQAS